MIQKLKEGWLQILIGWGGLILATPAIFITVVLLVLIAKYVVKMSVWLWSL